jgi:hypothetical protein
MFVAGKKEETTEIQIPSRGAKIVIAESHFVASEVFFRKLVSCSFQSTFGISCLWLAEAFAFQFVT